MEKSKRTARRFSHVSVAVLDGFVQIWDGGLQILIRQFLAVRQLLGQPLVQLEIISNNFINHQYHKTIKN